MELAKLVLEYWKASVWPLVFVIAVFVFRDQIRDALRRARAIDAMGVNVELAERVEEAQEALEEVREGASSSPPEEQLALATSAETVRRARKALEAIGPSQDRSDPPLGRSAMPFVISFRSALNDTAAAFDRERFDYKLAEHLAQETGLLGWSVLVDLRRLLTSVAARSQGSAPVPETAMISHTAKQARATLVALLKQAAGDNDGRDAP